MPTNIEQSELNNVFVERLVDYNENNINRNKILIGKAGTDLLNELRELEIKHNYNKLIETIDNTVLDNNDHITKDDRNKINMINASLNNMMHSASKIRDINKLREEILDNTSDKKMKNLIYNLSINQLEHLSALNKDQKNEYLKSVSI